MPKIVIYSQNTTDKETIAEPLKEIGYIVAFADNLDDFYAVTQELHADIAILSLNEDVKEVSHICRKIRLLDQADDIQIILLTENNITLESISQDANGYIQRPINTAILISTVNAHLRIKNNLDIYSTNNSELAKRFYQLKVLYDTSSKLAGTLNRRKLINIMNDGLEQSISYSLCLALIINNSDDILLLINSMYPITKRLEQALKLRAIITYKSMFTAEELPLNFTTDQIKTEIIYKQDDECYDLETMSFASIFSPISTQDKFFGTVEIMRDTELSREDTTCFQTVVSQVALPLESAILYEEIKEKNIKLEKLEKLKSEFISIVSHELRTPLTPINTALDMILLGKTGEINDNMAKFLTMGKNNVKRLSGIINDLLDLSKIEAGKMEYHFEKTKLDDAINSTIETFKPMAMDKNIEFYPIFDTSDVFVYADAQKIVQILSNLVSNALKFTPQNGSVSLRLYSDNNSVCIDVKDTGIGINPDNIGKVFDKFQQIESSLVRKVGGTGLGLPIAKEFILAHNGQIKVDSEENVGSVFSICLPVFDEYTAFLIELSNLYENSKDKQNAFGFAKINTNTPAEVIEFLNKDKKYKNLFVKNDMILFTTQSFKKLAYENYLEKLNNFVIEKNNANIFITSKYCDFEEEISFQDLIAEFEEGNA